MFKALSAPFNAVTRVITVTSDGTADLIDKSFMSLNNLADMGVATSELKSEQLDDIKLNRVIRKQDFDSTVKDLGLTAAQLKAMDLA